VLHRWLTYFDKKIYVETIKIFITMDSAIQKAYEKLLLAAQDEEFMREYHIREKALSDYASRINNAKREERQETTAKIARSFKAAGAPLAMIQACTDLSLDEIERL
jgi:predicted transposase/invertase (TIGR01784 family)